MEESKWILEIIGNNIKAARTLKGITQEQLAEEMRVSDKFISMAERGASGLSLTSIVNLCKFLDMEPNTLFNGIVNFTEDIDTQIKNQISLLSHQDKIFLLDVIKYILSKGSQ